MFYINLPKPLSAAQLMALGYRRISNKHRMVSRIDRKDWQQVLFDHSRNLLLGQDGGADYYRRVFSKDTIEAVPIDIFRDMQSSDCDPVGFILEDGTPHPGYKVVLVEVGKAE